MILDDETLIVKGLQHILEWEKLGIEIVQTASNGVEGLEKFKENPVDIIITDINMPKLTGIEFIKCIKAIDETVEFVILSGYDEFKYAKKAIELGVKGYLLKPVDDEEFETIIKTITTSLDKKRTENPEQIFYELLSSQKQVLTERSKQYIEQLPYQGYVINIVKVAPTQYEKLSLIEEWLAKQDERPLFMMNLNQEIIIVDGVKENLTKDQLELNYCLRQTQILNALNVVTTIIVGDCITTYNEFSEAYQQVKVLRRYQLVNENKGIITSSLLGEHDQYNQEIDLSSLQKFIIEKQEKKATEYIKTVFESQQPCPDYYYHVASKIIILLNEIVGDFSLQDQLEIMYFYSMMSQLNEIDNRQQLEEYLILKVEEIISIIKNNKVGYTPVVQQLITYVQNYYYEDMSLKVLSYKYNVNPSYLGQIFLKEVGCSFAQYLNQVKSKEAKHLILNTNMKMSEISKKVGYPDTSYFYRKFKEYYGVSPATLREIKQY